MWKKAASAILIINLLAGLFCISGCTEEGSAGNMTQKELNLCVGDTYDFDAMGYTLEKLEGKTVSAVGNVITAESVGFAVAIVRNEDLSEYRYQITVYADAAALGDRFFIDKGMFQGKRTIVFGTSITDGALGDPNTFTGMNYTDTYFALLCNYLGVITDPTDLRNCNLACGGTTISYVGNNPYGISGVERIEATEPFSDGSRVRDPYPNILRADLCVIYYGGNDLVWNVLAESNGMDGLNDRPTRAEDAKTVKGALYYMITKLHEMNPDMKILVLPPLYRRADGVTLVYSEDKVDVINAMTGVTVRDYIRVMKEVCEEQGAMFVDWYPLFDYENFGAEGVDTYSGDGLHPNVEGHKKMFEYLMDQVSK